MNVLEVTNPLNLAHGGRKHPPLRWIQLGVGILMLLASLWSLHQSWQSWYAAQSLLRVFNSSSENHAAELRRKKIDDSNASAKESDKIQHQVLDFLYLSWDGIFDALEVAADTVRNGVSIVSLIPTKVQPNVVQLNISALASNAPIMLSYLSALKSDPRVIQVELVSQQQDDKSGPRVIRFQINLLVNPKIQLEHPVRPAWSAPSMANDTTATSTPSAGQPNSIVPASILQGARRQ